MKGGFVMNTAPSAQPKLRSLAVVLVVFSAAMAVMPANAAAQEPPSFHWNVSSGSVSGRDFAPDASVDVVVRDSPDGLVVYQTSLATDSTGYFEGYGPADLVPGMEVTAADGSVTKTLLIADVAIEDMDIAANTVGGTAPSGADVWVQVGEPWWQPWSDLTVTADGGGNWSADFTGLFDLGLYTEVYASVFDDDGDFTSVSRAGLPGIGGWLNNDQVEGWGFSPSTPIQVVVRDAPNGEVVFETTTETNATGGFRVDGYGHVDLAPGMEITASDQTWTKVLLLITLSFEHVDLAADTVSGTSVPGSFGVTAMDMSTGWPPTDEASLSVTADSTGAWSANFSGVFDINSETWFSAVVADDDGDESSIQAFPPSISADLTDDTMSGGSYGPPGTLGRFAANASVDVTVKVGPGGDIAYATTAGTDGAGNFALSLVDEIDLVPGMEITASDGNHTRVLLLASLAIDQVDLAADTVSGTAPSNLDYIEVEVPGITLVVGSDGAGSWTADFSGRFDIDATTEIWTTVPELDWDTTLVHHSSVLDQLDGLIAAVDASTIKRTTKFVLLGTLQRAHSWLVQGKLARAYLALEVFVVEVRVAQALRRILALQATSWIASARQIGGSLGY